MGEGRRTRTSILGKRATTRGSSGSDERAWGANEDGLGLRDALVLPPPLPSSTVNTSMMAIADGDEDRHCRNEFER